MGRRGSGKYEAMYAVEDGGGWAVSLQQYHPNSARSLVIARRMKWNVVLLFSLCCRLPPKVGETGKIYR